jgi:hypothetical protein
MLPDNVKMFVFSAKRPANKKVVFGDVPPAVVGERP